MKFDLRSVNAGTELAKKLEPLLLFHEVALSSGTTILLVDPSRKRLVFAHKQTLVHFGGGHKLVIPLS